MKDGNSGKKGRERARERFAIQSFSFALSPVNPVAAQKETIRSRLSDVKMGSMKLERTRVGVLQWAGHFL